MNGRKVTGRQLRILVFQETRMTDGSLHTSAFRDKSFRGFAKGWFPKGWFWQMFHCIEISSKKSLPAVLPSSPPSHLASDVSFLLAPPKLPPSFYPGLLAPFPCPTLSTMQRGRCQSTVRNVLPVLVFQLHH